MNTKFTLIFMWFSYFASAQNEANNWYYGEHAGITFNTIPPVALPGGQIYTNEGCSSISDAAGNLLFYSDGVKVWNRNHVIMPNGTGLHGNFSSSQSCLIANYPGSPGMYFIFTAPDYAANYGLQYSIIDMALDGGFGDVTAVKNVVLLPNSTEKLTACAHRNGIDFWVVGHEFESANFYAWQVSSSGVSNTPVISASGTPHESDSTNVYSEQNRLGTMKISPCGDKIACCVLTDSFLELFDFNDSTGIVSNPLLLGTWPGLFPYGIYGVEFSSGCTKLYASNENPPIVVQYDLLAGSPGAIVASADTVCTSTFDYYGTLQNGPDGLMYLARLGNNDLGCITQPDMPGMACAYVQNYASAPNTSSAVFGLPNYITTWFRNSATGIQHNVSGEEFALFPNPVSTVLQVNMNSTIEGKVRVQITNTLGTVLYTGQKNESRFLIPFNNYPQGIYFIKVEYGNKFMIRKILKL